MELVQWNAEDIAAVDTSVAGIYEIHGTVTFSKEITAGNYQGAKEADVVYTLTVLAEEEENLIVDEADAGFEKGENFTVEGTGVKPIPSSEDVLEGNGTLHWYGASSGNQYSDVSDSDRIGVWYLHSGRRGNGTDW